MARAAYPGKCPLDRKSYGVIGCTQLCAARRVLCTESTRTNAKFAVEVRPFKGHVPGSNNCVALAPVEVRPVVKVRVTSPLKRVVAGSIPATGNMPV